MKKYLLILITVHYSSLSNFMGIVMTIIKSVLDLNLIILN